MRTLFVLNDFPPKHGGIQTYLWELVRRLPADEVAVLTLDYPGAAAFDADQGYPVVRVRQRVLWPTASLARRIAEVARDVGATRLVVDPPIPLGLLHRRLALPYAVVLHGGVVLQARLPGLRPQLADVLAGASHVITAGNFPADEARRAAGDRLPPVTVVAPGVDLERFHPIDPDERARVRRRFDLPVDARLVLSISRLVPRKGFDVLIDATARLAVTRHDLTLAIGGGGRDAARLAKLVKANASPARMLGRVPDEDLAGLYAAADVYAMVCRNRWAGLEQEGFGVVFLEAAASGVPVVAGHSGGAAEAVDDGVTGAVVRHPRRAGAVADALAPLLDDADLRRSHGAAARRRAEAEFSWDHRAALLASTLAAMPSG